MYVTEKKRVEFNTSSREEFSLPINPVSRMTFSFTNKRAHPITKDYLFVPEVSKHLNLYSEPSH